MGSLKRINWGKNYPGLPPLDLIEIQKTSWADFLKTQLSHTIRSISPIVDYTGNNWQLELMDLSYDQILMTPKDAKRKGLNYTLPLRIKTRLTNKRTNAVTEENVFFFNLPTMTPEGTFIINGIERGVINQLVRSPGIYFTGETDPATGKTLHNAEVRPVRGSWLEFFIGKKDVIFARIDRKKKFPATVILRAVANYSDQEFVKEFSDYILSTIQADPAKTADEAVEEFYRKLRPGEPVVLENAYKFFQEKFFDLRTYEIGNVGRYKINKKFNFTFSDHDPTNWVLKKEDLMETVKRLIGLQKGEIKTLDDIDSLANRRLRCCGEIVAQVAIRP